jgi:uncharacterized protein YlaI
MRREDIDYDRVLADLFATYVPEIESDIFYNTQNFPDIVELVDDMSNDELIRYAQAQAQQDAQELATKREHEFANRVLKTIKSKGLLEIKEKLDMAKKAKMRVVEHYLCDGCDSAIQDPSNGFVIHGNIYSADPSVRGGIIGNNFPEDGEKFTINEVQRSVLCKKCFCAILDLPYGIPSDKKTPMGTTARKYKR